MSLLDSDASTECDRFWTGNLKGQAASRRLVRGPRGLRFKTATHGLCKQRLGVPRVESLSRLPNEATFTNHRGILAKRNLRCFIAHLFGSGWCPMTILERIGPWPGRCDGDSLTGGGCP